jgi:hypothetical protein
MNRQNLLLKISMTLSVLIIFQAFAFSEEVARRITYEAKYTTVKPVIDGFADPVWDAANEGKMDQIVEGSATTADGTFKVLWDEENLYLFIQVNDPIRSPWDFDSENVNPWMYDNVEVFLGPANHPEKEYKTGDHQYRFTPGIPNLYNPWADPREVFDDLEVAEQDNTSNYVFEVAWPWEHIMRDTLELISNVVNGMIMEFEMQFADNNTIGEPVRDNVVAWNNDTKDGNSWNNTDLWGFLKLVGGPGEGPSRRITYEAVYTPTPPVIDGFADPVWDTANEGKMDQIVEGGPTTADGTFKVLWDEDNLYFYIQVNDPIRSPWEFDSENVNPWMYDNVEVFLGPANHPVGEYKTGDHQYRFTPGIPGLYNPWADPRTIDETVEFAEQDNTSNYVFEIAWPWTHILRDTLDLLPKITTNHIMEFEIQFADNNTIGEPVRDNVIAWNNDSDDGNSWNNTLLWGFMKLTGDPVNVTDIRQNAELKVYPSPARDYIKIESQHSFSQIFVTNLLGQNILQKTFSSSEFNYTLELSQIEKGGVYFLNVITEKGRESRKFIITK